MTAQSRHRPAARPGSKAARRRAIVSTYSPRFELWSGADPWDTVAENTQGFAPLDDAELRALGLEDLIPHRL